MKLPLWRAIAGLAVLAGLLAALVAMAPVFVKDYRLRGYMKTIAADPSPDDTLRTRIVQKAHDLNLPVLPGQVSITHTGGARQLQANYFVEMDLKLYQVNLHFHPHAAH